MTYLGPGGSQMGHKETMKDTARVLGRIYDAIEYRGFAQDTAEKLAHYSGVPVYNGLTDEFHPTQILADFLTMREHSAKPLDRDHLLLPRRRPQQHGQLATGRRRQDGHGRAARRPEVDRWPRDEIVEPRAAIAAETGARITITDDVAEAVKGADFLLHRRVGLDGRGRRGVGRAHQSC